MLKGIREMFVINCKNYEEATGARLKRLVGIAGRVSKKYSITIAIAPPPHLLGTVTGGSVPILAQHSDDSDIGSTTGFVAPELLKKSGVSGSLLNHSEHRIPGSKIEQTVKRLRKSKMISIVCVRNVAEAKKYSKLNPDYIAIEPPELIGSGRSVSKHRPDLITSAAKAVTGSRARLLCGAGIISGGDVSEAVRLGSRGILVASGIVKAKNWEKAVSDFASSMV